MSTFIRETEVERRLCAMRTRITKALRPNGWEADLVILRVTNEEAQMLIAIIEQTLGEKTEGAA